MVTNNGHNFSERTYCGILTAIVLAYLQLSSGEHTESNVEYPHIGNIVSWEGKNRQESDLSHRDEIYDTVDGRGNSNDFNHLNNKINNFIKDKYVEDDNWNEDARIQPMKSVNSKNREVGVGPLKFVQDPDVDDVHCHGNNDRYSSLTSSVDEEGVPPRNYCFNSCNNDAFNNDNNLKPLMDSKSNYKENHISNYKDQLKPNEFYRDEGIIQKNILQNPQVAIHQHVPPQTQKGNIFYRFLPEIAQKDKTDESTNIPPAESNFNNDLKTNKNPKFGSQEFPKNEKTDDNWGIKNIFKPKSECLEIIENGGKNEHLQTHTNDIKSNSENIKMVNIRPQNANIQSYGNDNRQQSENFKTGNIKPQRENIQGYVNNIRLRTENLKPENIRPQNENVQSYGIDIRPQPENLKFVHLRPPNENVQGYVNNIRLRTENLKPENIRPQNENVQSYGKDIRPQPENLKFVHLRPQNENMQSYTREIGVNPENVKLGNIRPQNDYMQGYARSKSEHLSIPQNENIFNYVRSYPDDFKIPQDVNIQSYVRAKSELLKIPQNDESKNHIEHFLSNGKFSYADTNKNTYQGNKVNTIKSRNCDEIAKSALKQTGYCKIDTKTNKIPGRLIPNRNLESFHTARHSWDDNRISEHGQIVNESDAHTKEKTEENFEDSEYYDKEEKNTGSNNYFNNNDDTYQSELHSTGLDPEQLNSKLAEYSNGNIENSDEINKYDDINEFVQHEPLVQKRFNNNNNNNHNNVHISPESVEQNLELEDDSSLNEDYKRRASTELWENAKTFNTPLDRGHEDKQAIVSYENGRLERSNNNTAIQKNVSSEAKVKNSSGEAVGHNVAHNETRFNAGFGSTTPSEKNDYNPSIFAIPTPMAMLPAGAVNPNGSNTNLSISCRSPTTPSRSFLCNTNKSLVGNGSDENNNIALGNSFKATPTTGPNQIVAEAIMNSIESKEAIDSAAESIETVITDSPLKSQVKSSHESHEEPYTNISSLNNIDSDKKTDNSSKEMNVKLNTVNSALHNFPNSSDVNKKPISKSEVLSKNKSGKSASNTKKTSSNDAAVKRYRENKNNEEVKKEVGIKNKLKEREQDEEVEDGKPYSQWMDIDYDDRNRRGINCGCFPVNEDENDTNMVSEDNDEESNESFYSLMNKNHPKSFLSRTYHNWLAEREGRELVKSNLAKTLPTKVDNGVTSSQEKYNFKGNYEEAHFRPMQFDDPELALIRHQDEPPARNDQSNRGSDLFNYDDNGDADRVPLVTHTPIKHVKWYNLSDVSDGGFASNTHNM